MVPTLDQLHQGSPPSLLLRCIAGSRAYGLAGPASDEDIRGVFLPPRSAYLSLADPPQQVADPRGDIVYYTLRRFLEFAAKANPNILELLFPPEGTVLHSTPEWQLVQAHRELFITRAAFSTHVSYAQAQVRKARGKNKWVHNPQPEDPPRREDFFRFIPRTPGPGTFPYRPMPLADAGVDLSRCHAAQVEHIPDVYRIYEIGESARGVFRGAHIVCERIPRELENERCIGLLIDRQQAYSHAVTDHRQYWQWRRERNEARWVSQESGETDYDAKNMMHTFRLLLSGASILREGQPRVRFEGPDRDFLLAIKRGTFAYDELLDRAEALVEELSQLHDLCTLPDTPDPQRVDALLAEVYNLWETRHDC